MDKQVKIRVVMPDDEILTLWAVPGKKLQDILMSGGIESGGICAGNGTCGKCRVRIQGKVNEITPEEKELLWAEEIRKGFRLACYCTVNNPITVFVESVSNDAGKKAGIHIESKVDEKYPLLKHMRVFIPGLDRDNPMPIYRRLLQNLSGYQLELNIDNLSYLSTLDREGRPTLELTAVIFDDHIVKYVGHRKYKSYGIALDIGTTTIFAALLDMKTNEVLSIRSINNMQRIYGADIISRLSYSQTVPEGLSTLQRVLINNINTCVADMTEENNVLRQDIYLYTVAANPVILHLLLGLNPSGLAVAPYYGIFADELRYSAARLGLLCAEGAEVRVLPQIAGFVGADTVACLLALSDNIREDACWILVDVGTSGEIVLGRGDKMWATSAAAGPAFEGGGISCGMRAAPGAVDHVFFKADKGFDFNILGNQTPAGICGSGVIDLIACLLEAGCIDNNGIITEATEQYFEVSHGQQGDEIYMLSGALVFTQEDIRQVQLAKSAVRTGIDILCREAEISHKEINSIYLAGAFGNYINSASAIKIGLLPPINLSKIKSAGNAAGKGAVISLRSAGAWDRARELSRNIEHVELASYHLFQEMYIQRLGFSQD